jgi:hypothetical protein
MVWTHGPTDAPDESTCGPTDEVASTIKGGLAYLADIAQRLGPYVVRAEPRQRALTYLRGLLSAAERKNS